MTRKVIVVFAIALALCTLFVRYCTLDGLTGLLAPIGFPDDTRYAANYSSSQFASIREGESEASVLQALGEPIERLLVYDSTPCEFVWIRDGRVWATYSESKCQIKRSQSMDSVVQTLGTPRVVHWHYSTSKRGGSYRERILVFDRGSVTEKRTSYYID